MERPKHYAHTKATTWHTHIKQDYAKRTPSYKWNCLQSVMPFHWRNRHNTSFKIHTDSLPSLQAFEGIFTTDYTFSHIIQLLHNTSKQIFFLWIRGHIGIMKNEAADNLAKAATYLTLPENQRFYLFSASYLKRCLKIKAMQTWQKEWNYGTTGRFTHRLHSKVSEKSTLSHWNLYIFATNTVHSPHTCMK